MNRLNRFLRPVLGSGPAAAALLALLFVAASLEASTLKIATLSPNGSSWMREMRAGAALIEAQTDGRVTFKFYPGGVMGEDPAVLRKVRANQLQGAAVMSGALVPYFGDLWLYSLPMMFRSFDEVDHVRRHMDAHMIEGLRAHGWEVFGLAEGGFAYPMSVVPLPSVMAARERKVWVPANDQVSSLALESFGISPIPLSFGGVLTGLQTGLIDSVAVPPIGAIAFQLHTKLKYVTDLPVLYTFGVLAVGQRAFAELSERDQVVVRDVMGQVFARINATNREDHYAALRALEHQGLTFVSPDSAERSVWRAEARNAVARVIDSGLVSREHYEELQRCLLEYREHAQIASLQAD